MTMMISDAPGQGEIQTETLRWTSPDGSMAELLPYGGRILGLFSPASRENFFWTHPALRSPETKRAFYQSSAWHNSGGDRTWLAPEVDFFYPDYPATETYLQPPQLDNASYETEITPQRARMANRFSIPMYKSRACVKFSLIKELSQAVNPLNGLSPELARKLDYAGYTLTTTLRLDEDAAGAGPIGIWNLLQLPYGGEMLVPTLSPATPVIFMGPIGEELHIDDHLIRYRIDTSGEHKIGVHPIFCTGTAAYLYPNEDLLSLVVRRFVVDPAGAYVDVPLDGTQSIGSAMQACSINSALGAFAELEYHTPAIGGSTGDSQSADESRLWAFRGPHEAIMEAARFLVSPEIGLAMHA
jgi:hypothetical protein